MYYYSIESVSISDEKYLELYNLIHNFKIFCVVDESITIKNTEAGTDAAPAVSELKIQLPLNIERIPLTQG